ncbi:MAG: hypothetical protein CL679_14525 [Bermanella sp.]|uniref:hypothetical protein n=1 Tax=uncultured Pseudoalteromonas sp. TaxID=114053 RepID=UPI000C9801D7|nr:hypothetical protein [uncultured Pseudoalteromonas sp.]MAA72932.1 hypothetical protein [Bermanella sp.]
MAKHSTSNLINIILIVFIGCYFMHQSALASAGRLVLPSQSDAPVVLNIIENIDLLDAAELLEVYVGNKNVAENSVAIAGKYSVSHSLISFKPIFEFSSGQTYTVKYKLSLKDTHYLTETFIIQTDVAPTPAHVTAIYPSGTTLPENILRFYIHFSEPMQPNVARKFIKLVDENGNADNAAFMNFKQELWSPDRKRLTLLMDPGRIKRLVATNKTLGPALIEGKKYNLSVAEGWPAASGNSDLTAVSKTFIIGEALRSIPTINQWKIDKPTYNSIEPITIEFDRPFDFQQLHTNIVVTTSTGKLINGNVDVSETGKKWQFYPSQHWTTNKLKIAVNATLEDVAGNNFKDLLDHSVDVQTNQVNSISIDLNLGYY